MVLSLPLASIGENGIKTLLEFAFKSRKGTWKSVQGVVRTNNSTSHTFLPPFEETLVTWFVARETEFWNVNAALSSTKD